MWQISLSGMDVEIKSYRKSLTIERLACWQGSVQLELKLAKIYVVFYYWYFTIANKTRKWLRDKHLRYSDKRRNPLYGRMEFN